MQLTCDMIPGLDPSACCDECHANGENADLHSMSHVVLPDGQRAFVCFTQMREIENKLKRKLEGGLEDGRFVYRFPRYADTMTHERSTV